jgi:hypothetical protein
VYWLARGETDQQVKEEEDLENSFGPMEYHVDLDTGLGLTREDVLLALMKFFSHILKKDWPPQPLP